jgi:hypothetical protein
MRSWIIVFMCAFGAVAYADNEQAAQAAVAEPVAAKGKMLVSSDGGRLGVVNRLSSDGGAQVILDGRLITVPASTLSLVDGKLTTSLSKIQVLGLH